MQKAHPGLQNVIAVGLAILIAFGHQYLYSFQSSRLVFIASALVYFFLGMALMRRSFVVLFLAVNFLWWLMVGLTIDFHGAWWLWALDIGCMTIPLIMGGLIGRKLKSGKWVFVQSFSFLIADYGK
jgi:hypothetical protein